MARNLVAVAAALLPALAAAQITGPVLIGPEPMLVHGGPGAQTEPHVSGSLISYTNRSGLTFSEIRYQDLSDPSGASLAIPNGGARDTISDVNGSIIVFTRTSGSTQTIMFFDTANPGAGSIELSPQAGVRRTNASIGGDTVAYQQSTGLMNYTEICISDINTPSAPATCITNDGTLYNQLPAVSPDGNVVVFQKCTSPGEGCDIYSSTRNLAGAWGTPVAITSGGGNDVSADTNGTLVVYASNATGDFDIYYESVTGAGTATRLELTDAPGSQEINPNISGNLIAFERILPGETNADIYIFDISTNTLYQLTDTDDVNEQLNDISQTADGQVYVVWSAVNGADGEDVWSATFRLTEPSPCEEEVEQTPEEVCDDPGTRPVLGTVAVTRTTGAPNAATTTFAAQDGESGVVCVYNQNATSGQVVLNERLVVGNGSFKHSADTIARAAELESINRLTASIAGAPGTSYEVVVYGEEAACRTSSPKQLVSWGNFGPKDAAPVDAISAGLSLPGGAATPVRTIQGVRVTVLEAVPGQVVKVVESEPIIPVSAAMGCSTSGGSALAVGALLALALWMMGRRRGPAAPARVRVSRR